MLTYKDLPLYEMTLGDTDGVQIMSIVNNPAIQIGFLKFNNDVIKQKFSYDEDKRIITGAAMVPELPIYRVIDGFECYVKFSADTIKQLAEKFMLEGRTLSVNIEHCLPTNECVITETYFINHERNIVPEEFKDLPDGTWMISMKVNDDAIWDAIKTNGLNGFSIEGIFQLDTNNFNSVVPEEIVTNENFLDWLYKQFMEN